MLHQILLLLILVSAALAGPTRESRIVGGNAAVDGQFPYMVSLRDFWEHEHYCGGSIFRDRWVVTAASCLEGKTTTNLRVVAGTVQYHGGINAFTLGVNAIIPHPEYEERTLNNNIALVRTLHNFVWSVYIQPIRLGSEFIAGVLPSVAMGWGVTRQDGTGPFSNTLQYINTRTLSNADCDRDFAGLVPIRDNNICTFSRVGQGNCHGDVGGPLVGGESLIGIFLGGQPCAVGFPDLWTRLSTYHAWILINSMN